MGADGETVKRVETWILEEYRKVANAAWLGIAEAASPPASPFAAGAPSTQP